MIIFITHHLIAPVFYKLLYMSITALVAGLFILLIRRLADKWFSPFWKYAMWVLVLAALVIPWRPQSNVAVMTPTEQIEEASFYTQFAEAEYDYNTFGDSRPGETEAKNKMDSLFTKALIVDCIIPLIWLCGMTILGFFMIISGLRLGRKIKRSAITAENERFENILDDCKKKLNIKSNVKIILQAHVKTPALFGLFRPKIILPEFAEKLSEEHLRYIITHELSHLKRGDGIINILLLALQTVYWFNPLTWFLFKFIRDDMELSNDAAVLKEMGAEERKEYSLSLVEVLAGHEKPALSSRLLCMVDSEKNLRRRIIMIKLGDFFKRRRLIIAAAGLLVIALTSALFLTSGFSKADKYKIKITQEIKERVDQISQEYYSSEAQENGFLITASKIHGVYRQNNEIRAFVTTYHNDYIINPNTIVETGGGVIPAMISWEAEPGEASGGRGFLEFKTANDGSEFAPSIKEFCKLPDGSKIKGLSSKILKHYSDYDDLIKLHQKNLDKYISEAGLDSLTIKTGLDTVIRDKPSPGIRVTIEDWFGEAEDAEEIIFETELYKYFLGSIRSDKIMLTFESGEKISLKKALAEKKISIEDLILNGLQLNMEPKNNFLYGSYSVPNNHYRFYINDLEFFPSNIFMFTAQTTYFASDELFAYFGAAGEEKAAKNIKALRSLAISGVQYYTLEDLESAGISVKIGSVYSSHIPVAFSTKAKASGSSSNLTEETEAEMFENAAKISSMKFSEIKKNMTMEEVMETLGTTTHVIGQGTSVMYYIVDGKPLEFFFKNFSDKYPFSGEEMKIFWSTFGAVSYRNIFFEDVYKIKKGMKAEEIVEILGSTIDVGSGRSILKYRLWVGMNTIDLTFNSGGGGIPYNGEEICAKLKDEPLEIFW